jgi:hypothetical protein
MELMREASRLGLFADPTYAVQLAEGPELRLLRERPDFRSLSPGGAAAGRP